MLRLSFLLRLLYGTAFVVLPVGDGFLPTAKWLMLRVIEDILEEADKGLEVGKEFLSSKEGKSGLLRGLASWSKRVIEYALPGEWLRDLRDELNNDSLEEGMVGTKSVRLLPR